LQRFTFCSFPSAIWLKKIVAFSVWQISQFIAKPEDALAEGTPLDWPTAPPKDYDTKAG